MIGKACVSAQGNINLLVFWLEKYLQNYNSRYKRSYDLRWWERHVGNIIPLGRRRQSVQRLYEGPLTWAGAVLPCKLIPALSCVLSCKTTPNDRESTKKCGFPVFCLPWILNLGGIWTFGRVGCSVWIGHLSPPFSKSISSILSKPRSPFQTTNSLASLLSQTFLLPRMWIGKKFARQRFFSFQLQNFLWYNLLFLGWKTGKEKLWGIIVGRVINWPKMGKEIGAEVLP